MILPVDTSTKPSIQLPRYAWEDLIYYGSKTLVYRALKKDSQQSVVIKYLRQDHPSFKQLVQFQNQYTITQNLSIPGVIKPLGIEPLGNRYALIMEDSGCSSLDYYARQQQMGWIEILGIALQLAEILHQLHQQQVVHGNIGPANILIHPDSKRVTLIDFSVASLRPEEQRSDLYALGVSLYQLGVNRLAPEVPSMLLNIVDKLIAKNTEDGYQSAFGLKHDLEKCLIQWKEQGEITEFALGEQDVCYQFLLTQEPYGRKAEEEQIQDDREKKRIPNFEDNICRDRKAQQHTVALEQSILALQQTEDVLSKNERRIEQQVTALVELSQSPSIMQGRIESAFAELTEITASTLHVERVSIWLLDEQHTKIECADLWMTSTQQHVSGSVLKVQDYSAYFMAIQTEPILSAEDAWNDERTLDFREGYLDVLDIVSMLDASFYIDGKAQGVICCEQVSKKRSWSKADQNFVRSIANLIALTLETKRHHQKSKALKQALADLKTSQVKLVQSEKMSALGELVSGVAHEINNPISCILGNIDATQNYVNDLLGLINLYAQQFPNPGEEIETELETVELDYVREDFPKIIRAMKDSGDRITSISKSLRTFSRADTDNKQSFNLQEGIESTLLILRHRLKANDQRPHIEVITGYGEIPEVNCFPGQLNQVFMNLLANAIDAFDDISQDSSFAEIQANPYQITIRTSLYNGQVKIVIADNGPGMSESVKNKVFDYLFTTKTAGQGTGLGLAIAQQIIVEAHNGTLDVQSQLGQGTTFSIHLPT